jgi:hypothetical protein
LATFVFLSCWVTGAAARSRNDLLRQQLTVYNTRGNTLIQFVEGRNHAVWHAGRNASFHAASFIENQCTDMQLGKGHYNLLDSALYMESPYLSGLFTDGNFLQFLGKRIVIFTRNMPPQDAGEQSIHIDIAILTQNVSARIPQIIQSYHPDLIVMDASNAQARIDRWEKECVATGVKCHRMDRDGAFTIAARD